MATIDLATYAYNLTLNKSDFTSGMNDAKGQVGGLKGNLGGLTSFMKTAVVGGFLAVGAAAVGMAIKGVKSADDLKQSLNGLQAETGATAEEMTQMEQSLKNIYSSNFGESFEDIAKSMANIKQTAGLTGEELEKATTNALLLRDTFEFDVAESTRAVNSLMKNFGVTSERAYELIAIGAQNGANKNDDLIDTLNEYAPAFQAMGFEAEDFVGTLISGAESGAFSIDKIGDAMKEFGIRSKDLSDTSRDAFESLGLDADEYFNAFAQGGDLAADSFNEVMSLLQNIEDPLEQNRIGVQLFGTQFEDLGIQGISALTDIQYATTHTTGVLEGINAVKYDTFGEAITGIGRQFETGFIIPLGEMILPLLNQFATFLNEHMPQIQATFEVVFGVIGDVLGVFIDTIKAIIDFGKQWVSDNEEQINNIQETITNVFDAIKEYIQTYLQVIKELWDKYGDEIMIVVKFIMKNIGDIIQTAFDIITKIFKIFTALLKGDWEAVWNGIKDIVYNILEFVWNYIKGFVDTVLKLFGTDLATVIDTVSNIFVKVKNTITGIVDGIKDKISGFIGLIGSALDKINIFNNKKVDNKTATVDVPSYDVGTPFVPNDGLALIHKGEMIVPAQYNPNNPSSNVSSTSNSMQLVQNISLSGATFRNKSDIDYLKREFANETKKTLRGAGVKNGTVVFAG